MGPQRPILVIGGSLLAGGDLESGETYPERLEAALRARGINARISAAVRTDETTAAALKHLSATLASHADKPDLAIVILGRDDAAHGISPRQTRANLAGLLGQLTARNIPVLLMGMHAPPDFDRDYTFIFNAIYPELAAQYDVSLVPFFLDPIRDKPDLFGPDYAYLTAQGVEELVAATREDVAVALPPIKPAGS